MKLTLLPEKCIACGLCQTYSNLFDYDDDGIVIFADSLKKSLEVDEKPDIMQAVKSCPTKALNLS